VAIQLNPQKIIRPFAVNIALVILLIVTVIFIGIVLRNRQLLENTIHVSARAYFNHIVLTRSWAAVYGGVYVEKKGNVRSNPYLKNPDIRVIDGRVFTKRNPALITREISVIAEKRGLFKFHITSLKPLNPDNAPDAFETDALKRFERGEHEVATVEKRSNRYFFRYMGPLITERSCLSCHAEQGYKEGDIRGGISVMFDYTGIHKEITVYTALIIILGAGTFAVIVIIIVLLARGLTRRLGDAYRTINDMAIKDDLTGLYNRRYFFSRFRDECMKTMRHDYTSCIMMIDADYFKTVNDTFGHAAGDRILAMIAEILRSSLRTTDIIARYGGEEFIVFLAHTDLEGALTAGEKIRAAAESASVSHQDKDEIRFTLSIGLVEMTSRRLSAMENFEELIVKADRALYDAKRSGRNRVVSHVWDDA
jgi:diguanylate cyclase (GGDEF)-like protein